MRRIFDRNTTLFEKILTFLIIFYIIAVIVASNVNLDIFVYAGFGTYVIIGLIAFVRPKILFEVLRKENEEYLVRNQRKIPWILAGFRYGGFTLALTGVTLGYVFIVYY